MIDEGKKEKLVIFFFLLFVFFAVKSTLTDLCHDFFRLNSSVASCILNIASNE
jgi:hypothetical protein